MKKAISCLLVIIMALSHFTSTASAESSVTAGKTSVTTSTLDIALIPEYSGTDYVVLNDNVPDFYLWQITKEPYVRFSPLDELGRAGAGMACLGGETQHAGSDAEPGEICPPGWHTERYDDLIEGGYLYRRARVIGQMLSADGSTPENLFTGTCHLNTESMPRFENTVADYIKKTGNHVIYRAAPVYRENDPVAMGVQIEAWSVEDSGSGICFNVFVYNVQPGVIIDYRTGESERDPAYAPDAAEVLPLFVMGTVEGEIGDRSRSGSAEADGSGENDREVTYILNLNSKKFHLPNCSSVGDMLEKNKQEFYGTRDEAIAAGYQPCGRCHP